MHRHELCQSYGPVTVAYVDRSVSISAENCEACVCKQPTSVHDPLTDFMQSFICLAPVNKQYSDLSDVYIASQFSSVDIDAEHR